MSLLVDPPTAASSSGPEQGVIDDARRRQRSRRRRIAVVLIALIAVIAGAAGILKRGGAGSSTKGGSRSALARARLARASAGATLTPSLTGGSYGWCVTLAQSGSCPIVLTTSDPLQGVGSSEGNGHEEIITAVIGPQVASVLANGRRIRVATTRGQLPYGLRVVTIRRPTSPRSHPGSAAPSIPPPSALVAVDAHGKVLNSEITEGHGLPSPRWWKRPTPIPNGPCQIHTNGLAPLVPEWGHVASAMRPYPSKIIGQAFFSCIDIQYYFHRWPVLAAVLLDAEHPGSSPAPLPGFTRLSGSARLFNSRGDGFHGEETAELAGNHWLVVAGGSGLPERLEVLRHLTASVRL